MWPWAAGGAAGGGAEWARNFMTYGITPQASASFTAHGPRSRYRASSSSARARCCWELRLWMTHGIWSGGGSFSVPNSIQISNDVSWSEKKVVGRYWYVAGRAGRGWAGGQQASESDSVQLCGWDPNGGTFFHTQIWIWACYESSTSAL